MKIIAQRKDRFESLQMDMVTSLTINYTTNVATIVYGDGVATAAGTTSTCNLNYWNLLIING